MATFDVVGVKLGMTPDQAIAALEEKGFSVLSTSEQRDWEAQLADEMKKRGYEGKFGGRVAAMTRASGPQDERIDVWYAATIEGARVASINYSAKPDRISGDAFRSGLRSKHGEATADYGARKIYCSQGEKTCTPILGSGELPHMKVQMDRFVLYSIDLLEGKESRSRRQTQFTSALETRAPKSSRTTF